MARSIIKTDQWIDFSSEVTVLSGNLNYARYDSGIVYISFTTAPFANTNQVSVLQVPARFKPPAYALVTGGLFRATDSDRGYGQVEMSSNGVLNVWYSKTTQYGIYGYIIYHT